MARRGDRDFEQLKKYWYEKLKESGFDDAETPDGFLKDWPAQRLQRDYTPERFKDKQEYYRFASQFLYEHDFDSAYEKKVWELHSSGLSLREIVIRLRNRSNRVNKDNVQRITSKYGRIIRAKLLHAED